MKKLLLIFIALCLFPSLLFAALVSTLSDNFNDNSIDTAKWSKDVGSGSIAETNNELELTTNAGGCDVAFFGKAKYSYVNSQATIKIIDAGNQSLSSYKLNFWISDSGWSDYIGWRIRAGTISVDGGTYSASYVAATYRYLRIRGSSTLIYFDYSSDGVSWTNADSIDWNDAYIANCNTIIELLSSSEASTTTAKVDDFNILPSSVANTSNFFQMWDN